MRDALSLFDQMVSFTQGDLTYSKVIESLNVLDYEYYFKLTDYLLAGATSQALLLFNEVLSKGFEGNIFVEGVASHFRDLLVSSDPVTLPLFEGSEELGKRYAAQAQRCNAKYIFRAIKLCSDCSMNYRASRNKRLLVELTLIQLSQLASGDDSDDGSGRCPKLKPIFNKPQAAQGVSVAQEQPAPNRATAPVQPAVAAAPTAKNEQPAAPAQPVQPKVEAPAEPTRVMRPAAVEAEHVHAHIIDDEPEAEAEEPVQPATEASQVDEVQATSRAIEKRTPGRFALGFKLIALGFKAIFFGRISDKKE
jgi:DNA polymerase-3 subunit gamma/tau